MLATSSPPAGGAALGQVIGVSIAMTLLTVALLYFGLGHRSGRVTVLKRLSGFAEGVAGIPGWAALPAGVAAGSLLLAVFGLQWDVSLHVDNGRDEGPLANPSHYAILLGLFGIFSAGWLAIVLPDGKPGPRPVKITRGWHAPIGGILMMACASFALAGFPLDDVWHRLFGQDVTLWGPTHLQMLSGAALTLIAILVLLTEGRAAKLTQDGTRHARGRLAASIAWAETVAACGGLLAGLSIYQDEFDYGIPQFRILFHPILIAIAASVALPAARMLAGRGAAVAAALFFIVVRGTISLIVTGVFGQIFGHFPLYLAEALAVEVAFLAYRRDASPWRPAALAAGLIGTVGVLAEYGWSHVWMPHAWPSHLLLESLAVGLPVALAGTVLSVYIAQALRRKPLPGPSWAPAAAIAVIIATFGILLPQGTPHDMRADVTLTPAHTGAKPTAYATVRLTPADAAKDADLFGTIAWQGKQKLQLADLDRISDGVYRTSKPVPVYGTWKTAIRLHKGGTLASVPIYLPADDAIPVKGVAALAHFQRAFVKEHVVLQREQKQDVAGWLSTAAELAVLAIVLTLLTLIAWGLGRVSGDAAGPVAPQPRASAGERRPTTTGVAAA